LLRVFQRLGEIMMVTTMVQVHESMMYKDRRDSVSSAHDSVAISVSSFKSEETDGWKETEEETLPGIHQPYLSNGGRPQSTSVTQAPSVLPMFEKGE